MEPSLTCAQHRGKPGCLLLLLLLSCVKIFLILAASSLKRHFPPFLPSQFTADLLRTIYGLQAAGDRIPFVFLLFRFAFPPPICVCIYVRACFRSTRAEIASLVSRPLIKLYFFPPSSFNILFVKKKFFILFSFPPHFVQTALPLKRSHVSFNWLCSASYVLVQNE